MHVLRAANQAVIGLRSTHLAQRLYSGTARECQLEKLTGEYEHVTVMHLQRESAKNALGAQFMKEFTENLRQLAADEQVRVLIINSKVKGVFCAGADLKERAKMNEFETVNCVKDLRKAFTALENLPIPTIAAINGVAFGGGLEMALAADFRVAEVEAKLGLVETSLAIIPGAGGTQRLARLVGLAKAKELILLSERISGKVAHDLNLVNFLTEQGQSALDMSLKLSKRLLKNGPVAMRMAKFALNKGSEVDVNSGLFIEEASYAQVVPTLDRVEGLKAFREKRSPVYLGK